MSSPLGQQCPFATIDSTITPLRSEQGGKNVSKPVAPVAYKVILELGKGRFGEFESARVHTRINSWGLFLVHKLTCGKRENVS